MCKSFIWLAFIAMLDQGCVVMIGAGILSLLNTIEQDGWSGIDVLILFAATSCYIAYLMKNCFASKETHPKPTYLYVIASYFLVQFIYCSIARNMYLLLPIITVCLNFFYKCYLIVILWFFWMARINVSTNGYW